MAKIKFTDAELLEALRQNNWSSRRAAQYLGTGKSTINDRLSALKLKDPELVIETITARKQLQASRDSNRIKDKAFRENARVENAVSGYVKALKAELSNYNLSHLTKQYHDTKDCLAVGVVQLSDLHFNEIVSDVQGNQYDFQVAAKRLRMHIQRAKKEFSSNGIKSVVLALTGDILNSDRRLDELLENSTNRSKATMLAVFLLEQAILDLNESFNVTVASVTGNESRVGKDRGWVDAMATENYDFMIHEILKFKFEDAHGVTFLDGDPTEKVVNVAGHNLLLIHGDNRMAGNPSQGVRDIMAKFANDKVIIDYVIFGHMHEALCSDKFSRSASMVGANAYSKKALNLPSKASQNLYIFWKHGNIDAYKVDLQNSDHIEGYQIIDDLIAYNAKSAHKCHASTVIHQVVI